MKSEEKAKFYLNLLMIYILYKIYKCVTSTIYYENPPFQIAYKIMLVEGSRDIFLGVL